MESDLWNILDSLIQSENPQLKQEPNVWLHLSLGPLEAPDDLLMFCCGLIFILLTQRLKVLTQQMCEEMNTDVFVFVCFFTASIQQTQCPAEHLTGNPQSQVRCRQPETTSFPGHSHFYP